MAQSTEMNTAAPMPTPATSRLQMEGLASAAVYVACFGWFHLQSGGPLLDSRILAIFLIGLILVPALAALPLLALRRAVVPMLETRPRVAAFMPFTRFALYALQGLVVWIATREAYTAFLGPGPG